MSFHFTLLGVISVFAMVIPSVVVLFLMRGVKGELAVNGFKVNTRVLRNLTVFLASFGFLHGAYHVLLIIRLPLIANVVDFITVLSLIFLGIYYSLKVS